MATGLYEELGIDPDKTSVREAFGAVVQNNYKGAFVNINIDPEAPDRAFTLHNDGDGSKFVQRLLHAAVTGNYDIMGGAVDDGLGMNTGDVAAAGFVGKLVVSDVININGANVPKKEVMTRIAKRFGELRDLYNRYGFKMIFSGGETADLPDQTISAVFDVSVFATARIPDLIIGNVRPGDRIFGFQSDGQAVWEDRPNSGIMSNGITLARTYLMSKDYTREFPHLIRPGGKYLGRFAVNDKPEILGGMSVSEAILSPTRQWAILIRLLIERLKAKDLLGKLHGISMNTGGGAYKIGHVGHGIRYVKTMPAPPLIFRLIQQETGEKWENMVHAMNCGVGLDVVCADDPQVIAEIIAVSKETGVGYCELGDCEASGTEANEVVLNTAK